MRHPHLDDHQRGFRSPRSARNRRAASHSQAAAGTAAIEPGSSRALQPAVGGEAVEFAAKVVTLPPKLIAFAKRHS
jgi:hypothetical protein